jgi:adenosylcobinamide amidohydrolase
MWLSSRIYPDEFVKKENLVMKDQEHTSRSLKVDLDYVKNALVLNGSIYDFPNKALVTDFTGPLSLISTLDGQRNGVETVGNNNFSLPFWEIGHKIGLKKIKEHICRFTARSEKKSSFLFTGVNIDNMAIKGKVFKEMEVYALVTAGVKSNSVRMSADEGLFYELGTINIILLPNMQLTGRAMQRAIISATEAKTAALQDLDIRSKYSPLYNQATGTGTI